MRWMVWRQHRAELARSVLVFAIPAVLLLLASREMFAAYQQV